MKLNPFLMAVVAGVLHYLATKYPELRDAIQSILVALGYGALNSIHASLNGGSGNGQASRSVSYPSNSSLPPP